MLMKGCNHGNGRNVIKMAQRVNGGFYRAEVLFPLDYFGDDAIRVFRKAVHRVISRLTKLGQNIESTRTHERIIRLAPCGSPLEYVSAAKFPKIVNGLPWCVIIVTLLEGASEKIVDRC